jgi:hypothetical protein
MQGYVKVATRDGEFLVKRDYFESTGLDKQFVYLNRKYHPRNTACPNRIRDLVFEVAAFMVRGENRKNRTAPVYYPHVAVEP